eukprot:ANDGO_05093.mRNA.1 hypothetical protein
MRLPERVTRGQRFNQFLTLEDEEADAAFWGQDAFQEAQEDRDFEHRERNADDGDDDDDDDVYDSDFDLNEPAEEDAEMEAKTNDVQIELQEKREKRSERAKVLEKVYRNATASAAAATSRKRVIAEISESAVNDSDGRTGCSGDEKHGGSASESEPSGKRSKTTADSKGRALRASTLQRVERDEAKRLHDAREKEKSSSGKRESSRNRVAIVMTQEDRMKEALTTTAEWNKVSLQWLVDYERETEAEREQTLRMRARRGAGAKKPGDPYIMWYSSATKGSYLIFENVKPVADRLSQELMESPANESSRGAVAVEAQRGREKRPAQELTEDVRDGPRGDDGLVKPGKHAVMCAVLCNVPARYIDPLSRLPYFGVQQFRKIRSVWDRLDAALPLHVRREAAKRQLAGLLRAAQSRNAALQKKKAEKAGNHEQSSEQANLASSTSADSLLDTSASYSPLSAAPATLIAIHSAVSAVLPAAVNDSSAPLGGQLPQDERALSSLSSSSSSSTTEIGQPQVASATSDAL